MVNKCELSVNRRQLQQAKDADRLGLKGIWSAQGLKPSLSWTNDHRRIERTFPTLADKLTHSCNFPSHIQEAVSKNNFS
jgi:hypothetical protein